MRIEWTPMRGSTIYTQYVEIRGSKGHAVVRTKVCPNGKFIWTCGKVMDYADTVEEAKDMVEGLWISNAV